MAKQGVTGTLQRWEAGPFNRGMNISMLPADIDDNEAVMLQDFLLDREGKIYTRGTVKNVIQNTGTFSNAVTLQAKGIFSCTAPDGNTHMAAVTQDAAASGNLYFSGLADNGGSVLFSQAIDTALTPTGLDVTVDAKPALGGGVWVGTNYLNGATVGLNARQCLFHWRGANTALTTAGTLNAFATGATTITGAATSWLTTLSPGMFLLGNANKVLIGVVKSIQSNTSLTLEKATWTSGAGGSAFTATPIRAFGLEYGKGRVSSAIGSLALLGSGTKFIDGIPSGGGQIPLRLKDNAIIAGGFTSSATTNEAANISAGLITMDNEPYVLVESHRDTFLQFLLPPNGGTTGFYPGIYNVTYAGCQWFARLDSAVTVGTGDNFSRIWFSDVRNQNSVDMLSLDGDFFNVPSTVGQNLPIRGIAASDKALLVFKENETFAIQGTNADNFTLHKIWDDGCLSQNSICTYKGTIIWAGRNGVYLWDGNKVTNLVARSFGPSYIAAVKGFDPKANRATAIAYRDTLFVSINNGGTTIPGANRMKNGTGGALSTTTTTIAIYLPTGGATLLTSPLFYGACNIGAKTYYLARNGNTATPTYIGDLDALFLDPTGNDFPDVGTIFNPDPYIESKRYSMGDQLQKKMFKQIMATLDNNSSTFKVEVAPGLGDSATVSTWSLLVPTFLNTAGVVATARVKFLKRDRHIGFKFYTTNSATFGMFTLRRWQIGFKWQKVGRI